MKIVAFGRAHASQFIGGKNKRKYIAVDFENITKNIIYWESV